MDIKSYFENTEGVGVLATADAEGRVDAAIYSRPHIMDSDTVAFIMRDRLTHHNLQSNPNAVYLFMETGEKFIGKRLFLTKIREEQNTELAYKLRRRKSPENKQEPLFLTFFRINKILPLIGPGEDD